MRVLLSWLKEFVDVPGTADDIARTMSVRGFAVEGIEGSGDDAVIDFEVTANRPDCMSIVGMAREVATAYALPLRDTGILDWDWDAKPLRVISESTTDQGASRDLDVAIDSPDLCPRYAAATADVQNAPTPSWMQARLQASGIRPISNIVDITNYVLLELGQPMHAFDLAKVGNLIRVRTAREGEALRTLDGQARSLSPGMLVIADAQVPIAVAGVMGGADSEVTASTSAIVFESAYFNPLSVRRTSKALGLKTEASMRFERGADPHLPRTAMLRALGLLEQAGAGRGRGTVVDRFHAALGIEPSTVSLRRAKVRGLLGTDVPDGDIERILASLGFTVVRIDGGWRVTVPTRRVDIRREVDLIEEIARHYGFDRIPVSFPALSTPAPASDPRTLQARGLRTLMVGRGFFEAVTFGFISAPAAVPFSSEDELVPIANPLSETFAVLRPSVLPGLVAAVGHNRRREQRDIQLFEIGARFTRSAGERRALALAWTGTGGVNHWSGGAREVDFFDIKGMVEQLCDALRVDAATETQQVPWLVPGRAAVARHNGYNLAIFGQLVPAILESAGVPANEAVYVAEIDLDAVQTAAARAELRVDPLPRYPSVTRDISILVSDQLPAEEIRRSIAGAAPSSLGRIREFDRYQGKGVPDGKVSLSLRLTFRSSDRTLTDAEVQSATDAIVAALKRDHDALQR